MPAWRRRALMEDIEDMSERDYLLSFESVGRLALHDAEARVRELAVRALWEYEEKDLVPVFLDLLESDPDAEVRAVAAAALGKYVFLGETEELPEDLFREVEERLLSVARGSDLSKVRRQSLESLGYSSNKAVTPLIETAYSSGNDDWLSSALFAMGRSANESWIPQVLAMLDHDLPAVRTEAARAAGELEASSSLARLLELLEDEDDEVRAASIWSLSQIGGQGVREVLEKMYSETSDNDEADLIQAALDNLAFTEDSGFFLMDVPGDDGYPAAAAGDLDDEDLDLEEEDLGETFPDYEDDEEL